VSDSFPTFAAFVEAVVLPLKSEHPTRRRLDGWPSGGNWEVAGRFWYADALWTVHADTHFEPLLLAYEAASRGEDPFLVEPTDTRRSLNITPSLRARMTNPRFKHIYVYEAEAPKR
jgi:hypothetical protein